MKSIGVVGLGKLGACIAASFAAAELDVVGFDIDKNKVFAIHEGKPPVQETALTELFQHELVRTHLRAVTDIGKLVKDTEACLFVVPTPSLPSGLFDSSYLKAAIRTVVNNVRNQRKRDYLFVINSTTVPGTCDEEFLPMIQSELNPLPFYFAYKPEFIAIGTVLRDLHKPDFLLVGSDHPKTALLVESLYRQIVAEPVFKHMSLVEAELTKISLNCAITMKISFANQVAALAREFDADPQMILDAVGTDHRIGKNNLRPGLPYGGPCFPRDNRMFVAVGKAKGIWAGISCSTDAINRGLRETIAKEIYHFAVFRGSGPVGILGQSYKPGTALTEDSPGKYWADYLTSRKIKVLTHDPIADHNAELEEVMNCPIVVVATLWPEYQQLRFRSGTMLVDPASWCVWPTESKEVVYEVNPGQGHCGKTGPVACSKTTE